MVIIGITGNIGCGKTTVAGLLAKRGVHVIDADKIVHRLLYSKGALRRKIVNNFGESVLNKNKSINHKKLARIGFANDKNWRLLCRIVHPQVIGKIEEEIRKSRKNNINLVALDAALLIEAGLEKIVDYVIVVSAVLEQQIIRVKRGLGLSSHDFRDRLRFQMPLEKKIKKADFIIDNSKTIKFTERQVEQLWKKITARQSR